MSAITDLSVTTADGGEQSLADYAGRVLLVVNTASQCGFTPQYAGLEELYRDYAERGLAVADKPDSHDICFISDGDTRGFLESRLGSAPG